MFIAKNQTDLKAAGVECLTCGNSEIYRTLDHKWLSYKFCMDHGLHQPQTLPLKQDTLFQCRNLAASTFPSPCFIKRTFNTSAGLGVCKVQSLEEYDKIVGRMQAGNLVKASSARDEEVDVVVQRGHVGSIFGSQSIWYKGVLVSSYIWKEKTSVVSDLSATILPTLAGRWGKREKEPSMTQVDNSVLKDALIKVLTEIGHASVYTGMMSFWHVMMQRSAICRQ